VWTTECEKGLLECEKGNKTAMRVVKKKQVSTPSNLKSEMPSTLNPERTRRRCDEDSAGGGREREKERASEREKEVTKHADNPQIVKKK